MALTNPGDIVRVRSRTGGRASVYEANVMVQAYTTGLFSGNGVLQNTSPDMHVLVGGSPSNPDIVVGENASGYKIALDIVGQQAISITAPASNSRITSIVAYTDDLSLASTDDDTTGNQSSCGLIVVNGTSGASPDAPTDSEIRTAITADGATGSQAVYGVIAELTIASTTTAITTSLIGMVQSAIVSTIVLPDNSVGADQYKDASLTGDKVAAATITASNIALTTLTTNTDSPIYDTGWVTISYNSGFTNPGFGYPPAYRMVGDTVSLRGVVSKSSGNLAAGDFPVTLPSVIRRLEVAYHIMKTSGSNSGEMQINIDGTVQFIASQASTTYMSIDGIVFMLD